MSWKYGYIRLKKENERLKERVAYLEDVCIEWYKSESNLRREMAGDDQ